MLMPLWFAQSSQPTDAEVAAMIAGFLMIAAVTLIVSLVIAIIICVLLYGALKRVPPQHRKLEPGLVWLLLIPLFNLIWSFFVFLRIPESYKSYFDAQGRTDVGDCGRGIGLAYAICAACSIVPCLNYLTGPAALVLLIIYLVKITGLKNQIPAGQVA